MRQEESEVIVNTCIITSTKISSVEETPFLKRDEPKQTPTGRFEQTKAPPEQDVVRRGIDLKT